MELAFNRRSADGSWDRRSQRVRTIVAVAVASALGGLARYLLGGVLARAGTSFPWETFVINMTGSFVLGFLFTLFVEVTPTPGWARAAVLVGFLGSYTTFSTFELESFRLLEDGAYASALGNILGSLICGLAAVYAGIVLARALA
jgi:fluoride exporter